MSIIGAKIFLKKVSEDKSFRKQLNMVSTRSEFHEVLNLYDVAFTSDEFEEAFNNLHTSCQTAEEADSLFNARNYYFLIITALK
jgi:hypothetical protein